MSHAEQRDRAREAALRLLAVRERSQAELRTRLRGKGFPPEVVEAVLDRLAETGLQDDNRFGARFAESRAARGLATRRIQLELRRRGLDPEAAAAASAEAPEQEEERARLWAARKARALAAQPVEVRVRRVTAALARRGYSSELCQRIAREVTGAPDLDDD